MRLVDKRERLTRRDLMRYGAATTGAALVVAGATVASPTGAWAAEAKAISGEQMATLIQMARDIYPHDRFSDALYAAAVAGFDEEAAGDPAAKDALVAGLASLDAAAAAKGADRYVDLGWEADRTAILMDMQGDGFFQKVRGGLVVSLYNQEAVWTKVGYEGESYSKGGYLERGFNDVNWL
jgi:hypothetical protein